MDEFIAYGMKANDEQGQEHEYYFRDTTKAPAIIQTAKGEDVQIKDSADQKLAGLRIYGKGEQIKTTGAQLFDISAALANQSYKSDGTIENVVGRISSPKIQVSQNINQMCVSYSSNILWLVCIFDSSGSLLQRTTSHSSGYTISVESGQFIGITFYRNTEAISFSDISDVMINSGNSALPWEPYTGGQPAPSVEYPQPINIPGEDGNITLIISNGSGTQQTLPISTPTGLPGVPVDSGGNYTDASGQQWISDYVDFERGKYVKMCESESITSDITFTKTDDYPGRFWSNEILKSAFKNGSFVSMSNFGIWSSWGQKKEGFTTMAVSGKTIYYYPANTMELEEVNEAFSKLISSDNKPFVVAQLQTPIETDLTPEELEAYRALMSYYPNTNISTDDAVQPGIEVDYVTDTKLYIDNAIKETVKQAATLAKV